ncbi:MAG: nucleotide exchange factor GrpE [Bacilli bacterium]
MENYEELGKCECENCQDNTCECDDCNHENVENCNCDEHVHLNSNNQNKEVENLKETIKSLTEQLLQNEEKKLRDKAEMINFRRRKDEEVSRIIKYSNEDVIKQILPTIDNFERAIKLDDKNLDDEVSKFLEGFKMIYCNLVSTIESFEVKAIDGKNKPFDPTYHEAVMTDHEDGVEPGIVLEVLQKGYILKDRVIRPAMVKVSE